jgi:hypothetical protein
MAADIHSLRTQRIQFDCTRSRRARVGDGLAVSPQQARGLELRVRLDVKGATAY